MKHFIRTTTLALIATVSVAGAAAPTLAADYRHSRDTTDYRNNELRVDLRLQQLRDQYNNGLRQGGFDRGEQRQISAQLSTLSRQADQFERSGRGIDDRERLIIGDRATQLWREMSLLGHDRDGPRRYY